MATVQFNCRIQQELADRLKQAATERQQTLGTLVAQALELLLAAPSSQAPGQLARASTELAEQLAALAKRLEALEAERPAAKPASPKQGTAPSPSQAIAAPSPKGDTGGAITTAELAKLTETNRAGWNNWAAKATPGETRHHPEAGSWQLVGKAVADAGGPARWLWQQG